MQSVPPAGETIHGRWLCRPVARRNLLRAAPGLLGLTGLAAWSTAAAAEGGLIHPISPKPSPSSAPSLGPLREPSPSAAPSASPSVAGTPEIVPDPVPIGAASDTALGAFIYYPDTGHNLGEPFRTLYEQLGAEEVLGAPLSEERFDDKTGWLTQYFAGLVLGYNPTDEIPLAIPLLFTDEQRAPYLPSGGSGGGSFEVTGRFGNFWRDNGGTSFIGNPLSNAFTADDGSTRQVFECAVLQETTGGVRLYPAWREIAAGSDLTWDAAFTPQPPSGGDTFLVSASDGLNLRELPGNASGVLVLVPENAEFIAVPGVDDDWIPGYVDGYAGWLARDWLVAPPTLPGRSTADWKLNVWQGASLGETNVREQPTRQAKSVKELAFGDPVEVTAWVKGEEVDKGSDMWAQVGPNQFIYSRNVGRNAPVEPPPVQPGSPTYGKWIDVNLTQQLMVAYDGTNPVRVAVTTTGMAGWETPVGWWATNYRVANEEMTSGAIGAESFFDLKNVLFTQYFTDRGHAIHFAWWRTKETIGRPGSHGCLNLLLEDSRFFWDWAPIGTPVITHYA
jgi:lipoprotein-anchoring transpeptidase ErfK/SrfK